MIKFEWDKGKAKSNLQKHKVSFEEVMTIWNDELTVFLHDPSHSDNEPRYMMIGYSSKNNLLFVSFTERNQRIRIISARKATKYERKRHEEHNEKY